MFLPWFMFNLYWVYRFDPVEPVIVNSPEVLPGKLASYLQEVTDLYSQPGAFIPYENVPRFQFLPADQVCRNCGGILHYDPSSGQYLPTYNMGIGNMCPANPKTFCEPVNKSRYTFTPDLDRFELQDMLKNGNYAPSSFREGVKYIDDDYLRGGFQDVQPTEEKETSEKDPGQLGADDQFRTRGPITVCRPSVQTRTVCLQNNPER